MNILMLGIRNLIIFFLIMPLIVAEDFHPDWAVEINGDEEMARKIATERGYEYIGKIGNLEGMYHFKEVPNSRSRYKRDVNNTDRILSDHPQVSWAEQQRGLIRVKRNIPLHNDDQRNEDKDIKNMFNDPQWLKEWYLYDARSTRTFIKQDLHVIPVWKMNITGRGVTVTIIDDGIEYTHPDLKDNYDPLSSTDLNDNDDDPMPNLGPGTSNEHGTRCAAEVAMVANNKICGVGIAYNAKIGGIRILDGPVNDILEAKALGFKNDHIDIYSASWGPTDDGKSMEKPGRLAVTALIQGVTKGRNGKGNLYVWASGNGGYFEDNCSCDGYTSSIYVLSISSISPQSTVPGYCERCSSTIASTFSSSNDFKSKVIAADVRGVCTDQHTGTSASAPLAAGIFALALEANPSLTWRDVKHLLVWTSQISSLLHSPWKKNAAGFYVNEAFGFGQIDATNLVKTSISWVTVPPMKSCTLTQNGGFLISTSNSSSVEFNGNECYSTVKFIEHIVITTTFKYSKRGALQIRLISPHEMDTILMRTRNLDRDDSEVVDWSFNSVHNWGEDPRGLWFLHFEDKLVDSSMRNGSVKYVTLTFHGTETMPHHVKQAPRNRRTYDRDYNRVKNYKRNSHSYGP